MLFSRINNEGYHEYMPFNDFEHINDILINNFYYCGGDKRWGQSRLLPTCRNFVVMTALKTGITAYLSSYFIVPLCFGIVRDIRNYVRQDCEAPKCRSSPTLAREVRYGGET